MGAHGLRMVGRDPPSGGRPEARAAGGRTPGVLLPCMTNMDPPVVMLGYVLREHRTSITWGAHAWAVPTYVRTQRTWAVYLDATVTCSVRFRADARISEKSVHECSEAA